MICSNCGTQNAPGARFCMECATPLAAKCPNCGTINAAAAKFCSECATPLAATARPAATPASAPSGPITQPAAQTTPVAERRLVSVLFADLVGFTSFSDGRDAEDVRELQSRYFTTVSDIIARYGGTVEKFIGDAVMALWGAPVAHEDDAERAVRAALDLVETVRSLAPGIEARAAVVTDEAAVTIGATNQGMVSGDMVNTASRLQGVAAPSTVLVGEGTMRAAGSAIVFETADAQTLKGKVAPVPAWRAARVVGQRGGIGRSEALEAPFVGRDEELRQLKDLFHATGREGRARLVSVIGPGGIGKSRLAWEFLKYVDGLVDNVWWHAGRSPAYGDGITFWALGEMIRTRAGLKETDDEATTRAGVRRMLEEHVPDPAEREWIEPAMLSLLGLDAAGLGAQQLFGAWRTFFERLSATSPVVLVFEDLHHADSGLLDFVDHLIEWSRSVPIFIVTLARPELVDRRPDWGAAKRNFTSIYLDPLPDDAMRQLLDGLVPGLPHDAREQIIRRADGIPLYAVETVRMLLAQGRLVLDEGVYRVAGDLSQLAVPETLTALISSRLDELDAADRSLIADAAVLGQSFSVAGLAAISGTDADAVEQRLRGLVRRELLVQQIDPRSPERGQYAFVQALIREVAYNTLAKRDRKVRHVAAARFFESLATDELAGALAGHYLAAHGYAEGPEADALAAQARVALRGAAERAAALGSHTQAIALLERALEVSPSAADRADLHSRAAASAAEGLVPEIGNRHSDAAVDAYRELGDRTALARAIAARADVEMNFQTRSVAPIRADLEAAWDELSDLEQSEAGVRLMLALARANTVDDDPTTAAWIERLLPVAERLRLLPEIADALRVRSTALFRLGRPQEALLLLRGAHELAISNNIADVHRRSRTVLTFYEQFNDPVAGLQMAREGLEYASRVGSMSYGFGMVGNAASCAIRVGEWAWAKKLLDEWLANEITGEFYLELYADRAVLRALTGEDPASDIAEAERLLPGVQDPQYTSYVHWARAWHAFVSAEFEEARREAVAAADSTNYFDPITLPLAARAALWSGDADGARAILDRLAESNAGGQATQYDIASLRAGIAALEGRRAEAISGYREALRSWRQSGVTFDEGLAALDMAVLLAPSEQEMADAAALIMGAREAVSQLGGRPLLALFDRNPRPARETVPVTA